MVVFAHGSRKRLGLRVLTAAALLLTATNASAFCRQRSCDVLTMDCYARDAQGCRASGVPVWLIGKISLWVDESGSPRLGITGAETRAAMDSVVASWMDVVCKDGAPPELDLVVEGTRRNARAGFSPGAVNINSIDFVDSGWTGPKGAAAVTTATVNEQTGELVDVDIRINSGEFPIAITPGPNELSLLGLLTHEVGHLIGLDHSPVKEATMRDGAETTGASQVVELESLAPDDIAGVCAIYETAPVRPTQPTEPDPTATPGGGDGTCALHSPAGTGGSPGAIALAFAAVVALRRRAR
jgi:hypothetical protein